MGQFVLQVIFLFFSIGNVCNCGETWIRKSQRVGPNTLSQPKTVTVVYKHCYTKTAKKVVLRVESEPRYHDTFNATVLDIFIWGFQAKVERTDRPGNGWGQHGVFLKWKAEFESPNFRGNPCRNRGRCRNNADGQTCACKPRFTGEFCQQRLTYCVSNPCHTGTCVELRKGYKCICQYGFVGERCSLQSLEGDYNLVVTSNTQNQNLTILYPRCMNEKATKVDVHMLEEVNNILQVKVVQNLQIGLVASAEPLVGSNLVGLNFTIKWAAFFESESFNENPCANEADCTNTLDGITCHCTARYTGNRCEQQISYCASQPCNNGGSCTETSSSFTCHCTDHYTGTFCTEEPSFRGRFVLPTHYVFEPPYYLLTNISYDRCYSGVARRIDTTVSGEERYPDTFNSTVLSIYPWGFQVKTIRTDLHASGWGQFRVELRYLVVFDRVDFRDDPCSSHSTHCSNSEERGRLCHCQPGWVGELCETELVHCYPNPCKQGVCSENENGYKCKCPDGVTGQNCSAGYITGRKSLSNNAWVLQAQKVVIIYDSCKSETARQVDLSTTQQLSPFFKFKLLEIYNWGFTASVSRNTSYDLDWDQVPVDLEWKAYFESLVYSSNPCFNGATCSNSINGPMCACGGRYSGSLCKIALPFCETKPCLNSGTCMDVNNGYRCYCEDGFGGTNCQYSLRTYVYEFQPSSRLTFMRRRVLFESCYGQTPEKVEGKFLNLGNYPSSFSTRVYSIQRNGFILHVYKLTSDTTRGNLQFRYTLFFNSPNFSRNPCKNDAQCNIMSLQKFNCNCTHKFTGLLCEEEIAKCSTNPCKNGGLCLDTAQGYNCTCRVGYGGRDCSLILVSGRFLVGRHYGYSNSKEIDVVYENCHNGLATTVTAVATGNETLNDRFSVKDIRISSWGFSANVRRVDTWFGWGQPNVSVHYEAWFETTNLQNDVCANGGSCLNTLDGPECSCPPGFVGKRCDQVDHCLPNPCYNGATCLNENTLGVLCQCSAGYIGRKCTIDVSHIGLSSEPEEPSNASELGR